MDLNFKNVFFILTELFFLFNVTFQEFYINKKLSSGKIYNGLQYEHILVEEKNNNADKTFSRNGCYTLVAPKRRLRDQYVIGRSTASDDRQCEKRCFQKQQSCRSFSYRQSRLPSIKNCLISSKVFNSFDGDQSDSLLNFDKDSNFFEINDFSKCQPIRSRQGVSTSSNRQFPVIYPPTYDHNNKRWWRNYTFIDTRGQPDIKKRPNSYFKSHTYHDHSSSNHDSSVVFPQHGRKRPGQPKTLSKRCLYKHGYKLVEKIVRRSCHVDSLEECEQECLSSRSFTCQTFSYTRILTHGRYWSGINNCLLIDLHATSLDGFGLEFDHLSNVFTIQHGGWHCNSDSVSGGHDHHPPHKPPHFPSNFPHHHHHHPNENQHETATGYKCYLQPCRLNPVGGFYFCYTGPHGEWDYCCRPNSNCQSSIGYSRRWCFVSEEHPQQWRMCNMRSGASPFQTRSYLTKDKPDHNFLARNPYKKKSKKRQK